MKIPYSDNYGEQSISSRFEQVVNKVPDKAAVQYGGKFLTYSQLSYKSERLADEIMRLRLEDNIVAAVFKDVKNPLALATAYFGVLKAGKCCMSLNSSEKFGRDLAFARPSLILTDSDNIQAVRDCAPWKRKIFNINELLAEWTPSLLPPAKLDVSWDEKRSFIVFTSGTSGAPKGVILMQSGDVVLSKLVSDYHNLTTDDVITCFRNNSAGINDIMTGLLNGLTVAFYDIFTEEGLEKLPHWLASSEGPTILKTVSSGFKYAVSGGMIFPERLRIADVGGEKFPKVFVKAYKACFAHSSRLRWRYSSTETRVIAYGDYGHELPEPENIAYTYIFPYAEVAIVDDMRRVLPRGTEGEIAVRGRYVSPGYWNNEELTKEKFVSEGRTTTYYTRDRGRMDNDGSLYVLGKLDLSEDSVPAEKVKMH